MCEAYTSSSPVTHARVCFFCKEMKEKWDEIKEELVSEVHGKNVD